MKFRYVLIPLIALLSLGCIGEKEYIDATKTKIMIYTGVVNYCMILDSANNRLTLSTESFGRRSAYCIDNGCDGLADVVIDDGVAYFRGDPGTEEFFEDADNLLTKNLSKIERQSK